MMFDKVLVAVDGSPHAVRALDATAELVSLAGGEARVVHVREVEIHSRSGEVAEETRDESGAVLDTALTTLKDKGVTATGVVRTSVNSHVVREVLDEAEEWGATVIVLASRGLSDLAGLVIGSTTHKILHLGSLPVLVVR